jgi:hypothetical protein
MTAYQRFQSGSRHELGGIRLPPRCIRVGNRIIQRRKAILALHLIDGA